MNKTDVFENEPLVTKEQEFLYDLIDNIAQQVELGIREKREKAKNDLLNKDLTPSQKEKSLDEYFHYRMNPLTITTPSKKYCLNDIPSMAQKLFDDISFPYSDSPDVLNWLSFWKDSFTFDDEILSMHNYRLNKSDRNLSYFVYILCVYISKELRLDFLEVKEFEPSFILPIKRTIEILSNLISLVMSYMDKCKSFSFYKCEQFILNTDDENTSFSQRDYFDTMIDPFDDYENYQYCVENNLPFFGEHIKKKTDEEIELECKKIQANHDFLILSKCIRSIYLLSAAMDIIGRSFFPESVLSVGTKCRKMCDIIFDDDDGVTEGAFEKIINDKRINPEKLEIEENLAIANDKENSFCSFLDLLSDEIQGKYEIDELLRKRIEWLSIAKASIKNETYEKVEKIISVPIAKKLTSLSLKKHSADFVFCKDKIRRILGSKSYMLSEEIMNTLSSAELLYDEYAVMNPMENFDYSGISALYYQALENTYISLFWSEYAKRLNEYEIDGISFVKLYKEGDCRAYGYIPKGVQNRKVNSIFIDGNCVKESCTFGAFTAFLKMIRMEESTKDGFLTLVSQIFGFSSYKEMFYNQSFVEHLTLFRDKLGQSTQNRNNASHGTEIIKVQQCEKDKITILAEERHNTIGLIHLFLSLYQ